MRRLFQFAALFILWMCATPAAHATWTLKQHVINSAGCTSPCTIAVSATTAGSLLVWVGHFGAAAGTMTSMTGGTSVHPASCAGTVASTNSADVAYVLSATGGTTSIVGTASLGFNSADVLEYTGSGPFSIDGACVVRNVTTAAVNLAGVAHGALTGTNDVILQFGAFNGNASGCPNSAASPADFPNGNAACGLINSTTIAAGTYTNTSSKASLVTIAFKDTPPATGCPKTGLLLGVGC